MDSIKNYDFSKIHTGDLKDYGDFSNYVDTIKLTDRSLNLYEINFKIPSSIFQPYMSDTIYQKDFYYTFETDNLENIEEQLEHENIETYLDYFEENYDIEDIYSLADDIRDVLREGGAEVDKALKHYVLDNSPDLQTKQEFVIKHNMPKAYLKSVLENNGLLTPSIAIMPNEFCHNTSNYGEICFVFKQSLLDNDNLKIYDRNAYTNVVDSGYSRKDVLTKMKKSMEKDFSDVEIFDDYIGSDFLVSLFKHNIEWKDILDKKDAFCNDYKYSDELDSKFDDFMDKYYKGWDWSDTSQKYLQHTQYLKELGREPDINLAMAKAIGAYAQTHDVKIAFNTAKKYGFVMKNASADDFCKLCSAYENIEKVPYFEAKIADIVSLSQVDYIIAPDYLKDDKQFLEFAELTGIKVKYGDEYEILNDKTYQHPSSLETIKEKFAGQKAPSNINTKKTSTNKNKAFEIVMNSRKELVEKMVEMMKKGEMPWRRDWQKLTPVNGKTNKHYHGINMLRLYMDSIENNYEDPRFMTFKQAEELGFSIKKGAKSVLLEKWIFEKEVTVLDDNGKPLLDSNGNEIKESVELSRPIINYFRVFNAKDIEGIEPFRKNKYQKEANTEKLIDDMIMSSRCEVEERKQDRAYYNIKFDKIVLPLRESFVSSEAFLATLLHEQSHSTGHESCLNRNMANVFGSEEYAKEELRAELGSLFTQIELGIDLTNIDIDNHSAYLQSWIHALENDYNELFKAVNDAEKISNVLVGNYEKYKTCEEKLPQCDALLKFAKQNNISTNEKAINNVLSFAENKIQQQENIFENR